MTFNERIAINGKYINDDDLLLLINNVHELFETVQSQHGQTITFFELTTLMSFMYFNQKQPDFVIYEVGLGGRLDATNVVSPLMTVITTIGLDHMNVLGNTLEKIAIEKLGIVKPNVPLVTGITQPSLRPLFTQYTIKHNSECYFIEDADISDVSFNDVTSFKYQKTPYEIKMMGYHQIRNACLAIKTIEIMRETKNVSTQTKTIQDGIKKTVWPGRMERFGNVILDGAHNVDSVLALSNTIQTYFPETNVKVLYTSMEDKEYFDVIQILEQFASEIYFTEIPYYRCAKATTLYEVSSHLKKHLVPDAVKALHLLKSNLKDGELLLVTGSLYFISIIRKELT